MPKYLCYRGEHGPWTGTFSTRNTSLTFSTRDAASLYATSPNDRSDAILAPRVIPAVISIVNPIFSDPLDPFVDLFALRPVLGDAFLYSLAVRHAEYIYSTNNWCDEINVDKAWDDVAAFLDADIEHLNQIYIDAYPILDDPEFVAACRAAGYDGAIHQGAGMTSTDTEYRIFDPAQAAFALSMTHRDDDEVVLAR